MSDNNSSSSGTGCLGLLVVLLTVLFVGLKLGGIIAWSWFWVISPILIYVGLAISLWVVLLGGLALWGVGKAVLEHRKDKKLREQRLKRLSAEREDIRFNNANKASKMHSWK